MTNLLKLKNFLKLKELLKLKKLKKLKKTKKLKNFEKENSSINSKGMIIRTTDTIQQCILVHDALLFTIDWSVFCAKLTNQKNFEKEVDIPLKVWYYVFSQGEEPQRNLKVR